jgi:hypothetical protein
MLIERRRPRSQNAGRRISDRYTGTGYPACTAARMPGAAVATGLEAVATYLDFLMAAINLAAVLPSGSGTTWRVNSDKDSPRDGEEFT